jgi:hypothetical protein
LTGVYAGYAELIGSVGFSFSLPGVPLALRAEAGLGSGGAGAAVDTGGGLLRKANAGLVWNFDAAMTLSATAGRVNSQGPFQAREVRLALGVQGWDGVPRGTAAEAGVATLAWNAWAVSTGLAHYVHMVRDDGGRPGLGLTALKAERVLEGPWRLIGQAGIAVSGNGGGYASGQLGMGWLGGSKTDDLWRVGGEVTLGAAGGGAVKVAGGLIGQAQLQARRSLSPDWAIQADWGWLRNRQGSLSTPFVGLTAVYSFSRLEGLRERQGHSAL